MWNGYTKNGLLFLVFGFPFAAASSSVGLYAFGTAIVIVGLISLVRGVTLNDEFQRVFGIHPPKMEQGFAIPNEFHQYLVETVRRELTARAITAGTFFGLETGLLTEVVSYDFMKEHKKRLAAVKKQTNQVKRSFWRAHYLAKTFGFTVGKYLRDHLPGQEFAARDFHLKAS